MNRTLLILKYELVSTLLRRSFLITTLGIPVLSTAILIVASSLNRNAPDMLTRLIEERSIIQVYGYVDASGIVKQLPESVPEGALVAYPDEDSARRGQEIGTISAYYLISAQYLENGKVTLVRPDFNPLSAFDQSEIMRRVLIYNLTGADTQLAERVTRPMQEVRQPLGDQPQREREAPHSFFIPFSVTLVFYVVILMAASFLLNSVSSEKENQVIEILLSSITPQQMLSGKILGLGIVGLLQMVLWVGSGYGLLRVAGRSLNLPAGFQLPVSILGWGLVFFLLGYAVYASMMAGLGALVPDLKEASQATLIIISPLIVPLFFISVLIEDPSGPLATWMSLFPLTAPVVMMTRLAAGSVPLWQTLLSAVMLGLTSVLIVKGVARLFRAQVLLSGQAFSLQRLFDAIRIGGG